MADEVKDVNETVETTTEAPATEAKAGKKSSVDVDKVKSTAFGVLDKVKNFFVSDKKRAKLVILALIAVIFVFGFIGGAGHVILGGICTAVAAYGLWVSMDVPEATEATTEEKPAE